MATPVGKRRGGQPGRSGPPGNLNAAKHGRQAWLKRRALPAHLSHVKTLVLQEEAAVIQDLGGSDNVTTMERAIVTDNGTALGLMMLALEEAKAKGCIHVGKDGAWDLQPGLQRIRALIDSRRMGFVALGLGRRAKEIDAAAVIEAKVQAARAAKGNGDGDGDDHDA